MSNILIVMTTFTGYLKMAFSKIEIGYEPGKSLRNIRKAGVNYQVNDYLPEQPAKVRMLCYCE